MLVGSLATSGTRHRLQTMLPARSEATISADSRRRGIPTNPCRSDPPACSALAAAAAARTWALVAIWFAAAMTAQPAAGLERPPQRRKTRRPHPLLMRSGEDCSLLVPMDPALYCPVLEANLLFSPSSALASLEDRDNMATSPPSNPTSPQLTKSRPAVKSPAKEGEGTA